jgi:hypothetical protein
MRWTVVFSGLVQAIWMLVDAFQLLRRSPNRYSSGEVWDRLVRAIGLDPIQVGPVLLVFGILWLLITLALASGRRRAYKPAIVLACASLWYALPGTIVAVIFLFALSTMRARLQAED